MEAVGMEGRARLALDGSSIEITALTVSDPSLANESRRWSTGQRGEQVDVEEMAEIDLSPFVTQALRIGASAITAAGNAQDTFDLERLVTDVGTRAVESSNHAAAETGKAVQAATEVITQASERAMKAMTEAESQTRKSFGESVATAKVELQREVTRLFGGDNPELLARLKPLLDAFGTELDSKVSGQTAELLAKAARQFDPSDPTSPMAKHARELAAQQEALTATMTKHHELLAGKVEALTVAVSVRAAAQDAARQTAKVTPLKGSTYADEVHALMHGFAAGLGDDYADTGAVAGSISRNKKGDGVLSVGDGATKLVLEMTDSARVGWSDYLEEAERNREAQASLGLVRDVAQNAGQSIRTLGPRRIVMAFDPTTDDANLLRTVVLLLRTSAMAVTARSGADEIATAEDKVNEALLLLDKIDVIQKTAGSIRKSADKIDTECDSFTTAIQRLLSQALGALAGTGSDSEPASTVDEVA
jgi:hypothetical protein